MSRTIPPKLLKKIRALVLDVDGVLTDGGMYYGPSGEGLKRFNVKDGLGLRMIGEAGIEVALISGENSEILKRRAEKLKIDNVFVGVEDKLQTMKDFLGPRNIALDEVAYVGDDLNDLSALKAVALPIAVSDAVAQVRKSVKWITSRRGGDGAVREVCDLLLAAR
ncbi:MAG TPA: HAD-IIIA family hydrolase [Planctomycetota bacterium]|nr:HAD-IIIA family hydrolase [Planctomycetota bacterium]